MFLYKHDKFTYTIVELLKLAPVTIDKENNTIFLDDYPIPFEKIGKSAWGFIYEKFVGQKLEQEGYEVEYDGINRGLFDGGIDLVAIKDKKRTYVQCKFKRGKLGRSHMNNILSKSSRRLTKEYEEYGEKVEFILVINNIEQNFRKNHHNKFKNSFTPSERITHPWLQYFLDHNYMQNKVILKAREIQML